MMQSRVHLKNSDASLFKHLLFLWRDPVASLPLRLTLMFIGLLVCIIIFFYWRLPPEIPLTYSRPWGAEQLVPSFFLIILFLIILLISLVNSVMAALFIKEVELLARMLVWSTALVVFLIDVTVLRVMLIIT